MPVQDPKKLHARELIQNLVTKLIHVQDIHAANIAAKLDFKEVFIVKKRSIGVVLLIFAVLLSVKQTYKVEAENTNERIETSSATTQKNDDNSSLLNSSEAYSNYKKIIINQISLSPGSYKQYGPYLLKKGDVVSINVKWSKSGNLYFAIGENFGDFRGLKSSGRDKTSFTDALEVKKDGKYFIFMGIQGTESNNIDGITGEIQYPMY